ncbi:MAG: S8 family peptidase [Sphingosinicella sp.]|uniref:S8 family peptidase n=1 Tax=Sphingosinicella sp. TaxID=1917971 RepID=UPI004038095E
MNFNDAEYQRSNAATSSGAISAWNAGGRGQNVTVGVIDSGINPNLAEFAGRIHPASADLVGNRGVTDTEGHGTAVSSVIGAARNGSGPMGVAFESVILSLNTADPANCEPNEGCKHNSGDIARAIDLARQNGARVVNISLGGETASNSVMSAVSRAVAAGMVIVMSAGNEGAAEPSVFAAAAAANVGNGQVIIAGAMDENRNLATFSNRAGSSATFYLVALGSRVRAIDENGTQFLWSGTSFSAPVISGAAALLASAFPNLTGAQIAQILRVSADDAGAAGVDIEFGNGILNITRAMQPIGTMSLGGSGVPVEDVGEGEASEPMGDASPTIAGAIILDGFSRAFAVDLVQRLERAPRQRPLAQGLQMDLSTGHAVAGATMVSVTVRRNVMGQPQVGLAQGGLSYDDARNARAIAGHALSRLSPRTAVALGFSESGRTLQQRLAEQQSLPFLIARDPLSRAGFHSDSGVAIGARHDFGILALTVTGERGRVDLQMPRRGVVEPGYSLSSLTIDRRFGRAEFSLGMTRLAEDGTVLGGRFAMAPGGATSLFLDAAARYDLGRGWVAGASYRRGSTGMTGNGDLVRAGRLSTDAWAVDLSRSGAFAAGDRLALRVMQPLRVRAGGYMLNLPVSWDYATLSAGYALREFTLAPSGREIDLEAAYSLPVLRSAGYLTANAFLRRDPGHTETARSDLGAAVRLSFGF